MSGTRRKHLLVVPPKLCTPQGHFSTLLAFQRSGAGGDSTLALLSWGCMGATGAHCLLVSMDTAGDWTAERRTGCCNVL